MYLNRVLIEDMPLEERQALAREFAAWTPGPVLFQQGEEVELCPRELHFQVDRNGFEYEEKLFGKYNKRRGTVVAHLLDNPCIVKVRLEAQPLVQETRTECQDCTQGHLECMGHCKDCDLLLCEECYKAHVRSNRTKNHVLQSIAEYKGNTSLEEIEALHTILRRIRPGNTRIDNMQAKIDVLEESLFTDLVSAFLFFAKTNYPATLFPAAYSCISLLNLANIQILSKNSAEGAIVIGYSEFSCKNILEREYWISLSRSLGELKTCFKPSMMLSRNLLYDSQQNLCVLHVQYDPVMWHFYPGFR